ncbi:hypothetical protein [Streptomyces sp. NPDC054784]
MAAWQEFRPCVCVAVDAQAYGSNNDRRQSEIQHDLPRLLDRAARSSGLDRSQWQIQHKGDEQLAVRPLDGGEPRLVDDYMRHLAAGLREYNAQRVPGARMRLRAVLHQGLVELADNGFAGKAVVVTARLLNSAPLYDALAAHPGADLALLLSDDVFRANVAGGHTTLAPEDFTRVSVQVKEYEDTAWLRVPMVDTSVATSPLTDSPEAEVPGTGELPSSGRVEPATVPPTPVPEKAGTGGMSNEYRADRMIVTNVTGPMDARGAVFGFGSTDG